MTISTDTDSVLAAPTIADVRVGLTRVLGEGFEDVWGLACAAVPIPKDLQDLDDDQFDQLLSRIADQGPLCRVLAMSWWIRRTAALKLAELGR